MRNFILTSSWTLPSHASFFTGRFSSSHGAHATQEGGVALSQVLGDRSHFPFFAANQLPEEAVTLAEVLRDQGYVTYGVGSGPWLKPIFGLHQGFDVYDNETDSMNGRRADEVNALALAYLRRVSGRPFFLFLNYFDPHYPYTPPEDLWEQFLAPEDNSKRAQELARYDAEISYMDRNIGELLGELKRLDLYDRSWIVAASDHGEHFGEHGLKFHGFSLYEGVVRGVLILKPPLGTTLPINPYEPCQPVDVMPTLLEALGIEPRPPMEGQPLGSIVHPVVAELFENPGNVRWRGERFRRRLLAVYSERHKLVVSSKPNDPDAGLFDLVRDPDEQFDLSSRLPDTVRSLTAELESWHSQLLPPLATKRVESIDAETRRQMEALGYLEKDAE
jgi:arylsulfatase A-like enzyme